MSAIASQFAIGVAQAMDQLGVTASYVRKSTCAITSLTAIVAAPEYQVNEDQSVMLVASSCWDILVLTSELQFDGSDYDPQPGDTVLVDDKTYVVSIDDTRRNCWTWADKHRVRRRLFTKIVSGE